MFGENIANDQYSISVIEDDISTRLNLGIMVNYAGRPPGRPPVIGPTLDLSPCDVDNLCALVEAATLSRKPTSGTWRGENFVLRVTKLDDGLIQFRTRASSGAIETFEQTMTIANVTRMLADLKRTRDTVERVLDDGMTFI